MLISCRAIERILIMIKDIRTMRIGNDGSTTVCLDIYGQPVSSWMLTYQLWHKVFIGSYMLSMRGRNNNTGNVNDAVIRALLSANDQLLDIQSSEYTPADSLFVDAVIKSLDRNPSTGLVSVTIELDIAGRIESLPVDLT